MAVPYSIMGGVVLALALVFSRVRLPEITPADPLEYPGHEPSVKDSIKYLWHNPTFRSGMLALFCYEIAEISINSIFINYATTIGWLDKMEATALLSFGALGLFMVCRIIGSGVMSRVSSCTVLKVCAAAALAGSLLIVADIGDISRYGIFLCYAFEAIMFPTIFAITISCAGPHSKIASSFLMMTPLGGAVGSFLMGIVIENMAISDAFVVPALGYAVVLIYAIRRKKPDPVS